VLQKTLCLPFENKISDKVQAVYFVNHTKQIHAGRNAEILVLKQLVTTVLAVTWLVRSIGNWLVSAFSLWRLGFALSSLCRCTEWQQVSFPSVYFGFPSSIIIPPVPHIH
jgi:hypothetical protein